MKEEIIRKAKKTESIKLTVAGQKINLICGFIGGVEANEDKDQIGAFLGDANDEHGLYYSLNSIIRSAIKAKKAIGESDEDIRDFLEVVFEQAIKKELNSDKGELN
jgi:hypothetical protein